MATEILSVPEADLVQVIAVIRAGLDHTPIARPFALLPSLALRARLRKWCEEEEAYLADAERAKNVAREKG